jgi:transcriptional regulator with XRE-family HTH domain
MTRGRRRRVDQIPAEQSAVTGANIRVLRLRKGWTQGQLGELMGWPTTSTVSAAEGHRDGRQRGFTAKEVDQLATIFGVSLPQLTTRCANCGGQPPAGFACLICGACLLPPSTHKTMPVRRDKQDPGTARSRRRLIRRYHV